MIFITKAGSFGNTKALTDIVNYLDGPLEGKTKYIGAYHETTI
ncbi:MAG: hypothetical protein ACOXZ4_01490 [Sphaerochaetaceae bacterium]